MSYKALVTVGACAFAGLAMLGFGHTYRRLRRTHLSFDFPMENLFI